MKFSVLLAIVAAAFSHAQDCNGSTGEVDASDFILEDQGDNEHFAALSAIFKDAGKVVNVSDVFAAGNHQMSGSATELTWDGDDGTTQLWMPQGITSSADAVAEGAYEGVDGLLISWFHRDADSNALPGVRIAFIDKATNTYRYALLVDPESDDNFTETGLHAGGIVWYGDTLWVVDTFHGVRIFDMSNIWEVSAGDDVVGKNPDGTYSAKGYRYVIPQRSWYKWTPSFTFAHSFAGLDRTTTPHRIVFGEYQSDSSENMRLVQYELDENTHKLKSDKAVFAFCVGIVGMQGAVSVGDTFYISAVEGAGPGNLWGWEKGHYAYKNAGFFPRNPEDVSYDQRNDVIYGLTEHSGDRYVLTKNRSDAKTE